MVRGSIPVYGVRPLLFSFSFPFISIKIQYSFFYFFFIFEKNVNIYKNNTFAKTSNGALYTVYVHRISIICQLAIDNSHWWLMGPTRSMIIVTWINWANKWKLSEDSIHQLRSASQELTLMIGESNAIRIIVTGWRCLSWLECINDDFQSG